MISLTRSYEPAIVLDYIINALKCLAPVSCFALALLDALIDQKDGSTDKDTEQDKGYPANIQS